MVQGASISSAKKSSAEGKLWRYPPTVKDIQVNHCKNPLCKNCGIPPHAERTYRRKATTEPGPGDYTVVASGKGQPQLRCELCKEHIPMQSNLAIAEELMRLAGYLDHDVQPSCSYEGCNLYGVPISSPEANYKRFGKTAAGSPRFRCLECQSTFSKPAKPTHWQHVTHKNREIFLLLMNTMPLKRIAKVTALSMDTVFRKIDFIGRQCLRFVGNRERQLMEKDLGTRYIATDRQYFTVNWTSRKDRRNVQLWAIGSADLETGYVFGMHLNFDGEMDAEAVLVDMARFGDAGLPNAFRRYARVWLPQDYADSALRSLQKRKRKTTATNDKTGAKESDALAVQIEDTYAEAQTREDIETNDASGVQQLPAFGMQVHEQVSMNAHLQLVSRLLHKAKKLRFFMDQEPGLRAAFMAALTVRVKDRTADAWFVKVVKEATIDEKRKVTKAAKERFANAVLENPGFSESAVEVKLMREEMGQAVELGKWNDRWLLHPLPSMGEPGKRVCWLTDIDKPEKSKGKREDQLNHAARLYLKASLHPIDRFFMQVRRGLSIAGRPSSSASNRGRVWNAYAAYKPENLARILEIFRVYHNYCEVGADKMTPAMRLGLAQGVIDPQDILYYA